MAVCACARPGCACPRRYPSDTSDGEWALLVPLLPVPACQTAAGGRPETHCRRVVVDAIRYVIHNGCVWRALPADFPPWRTVYGFYQRWNARGATVAVHDARPGRGKNGQSTPRQVPQAGKRLMTESSAWSMAVGAGVERPERDHFEGQCEGQNAADESQPEPVSAG